MKDAISQCNKVVEGEVRTFSVDPQESTHHFPLVERASPSR
jgi:hypothetical protein